LLSSVVEVSLSLWAIVPGIHHLISCTVCAWIVWFVVYDFNKSRATVLCHFVRLGFSVAGVCDWFSLWVESCLSWIQLIFLYFHRVCSFYSRGFSPLDCWFLFIFFRHFYNLFLQHCPALVGSTSVSAPLVSSLFYFCWGKIVCICLGLWPRR